MFFVKLTFALIRWLLSKNTNWTKWRLLSEQDRMPHWYYSRSILYTLKTMTGKVWLHNESFDFWCFGELWWKLFLSFFYWRKVQCKIFTVWYISKFSRGSKYFFHHKKKERERESAWERERACVTSCQHYLPIFSHTVFSGCMFCMRSHTMHLRGREIISWEEKSCFTLSLWNIGSFNLFGPQIIFKTKSSQTFRGCSTLSRTTNNKRLQHFRKHLII